MEKTPIREVTYRDYLQYNNELSQTRKSLFLRMTQKIYTGCIAATSQLLLFLYKRRDCKDNPPHQILVIRQYRRPQSKSDLDILRQCRLERLRKEASLIHD